MRSKLKENKFFSSPSANTFRITITPYIIRKYTFMSFINYVAYSLSH